MRTASSLNPMKKASERTAMEAALHLLGYRAQSEWEIRTKLRRKGYGGAEIDKAVEALHREHYLDDQALAEEIFEQYRESMRYGDRYIQNKLRSRGLSLDRHLTAEEEMEKAEAALRLKREFAPGRSSDFRRAAGFLLRRGFSGSVVSAVLNRIGVEDDSF